MAIIKLAVRMLLMIKTVCIIRLLSIIRIQLQHLVQTRQLS